MHFSAFIFNVNSLLFQSEQVRFGRAHSDDEEEESVAFYDRPSELMTTELARQRTTVSEPARLLKRPLLKVHY